MKQLLKFYSKGNLLVRVPGFRPVVGQAPKYVCRHLSNMSYPANQDAFVCEKDTDIGRRLVNLVKTEYSLYPADQETAKACGVKFVEVHLVDGEYVPVKNNSEFIEGEYPSKKVTTKQSKE